MRLGIEKQQPDIQRERGFGRTANDVHLPAKFHQREPSGLGGKVAAHFLEEVAHQFPGEVFDLCSLVQAIVERDGGRERKEFRFIRPLGADGARPLANEVAVILLIFAQAELGFVRPGLTAGRRDHENRSAIDFVGHNHGVIGRLNRAVSEIQNLFLDRIQLARRQPDGRQHGLTMFLGDAHHDVAAAQIVEIVREAQSVWSVSSGFQPCLNSSRSHSTALPCRRSSMLMGRGMK